MKKAVRSLLFITLVITLAAMTFGQKKDKKDKKRYERPEIATPDIFRASDPTASNADSSIGDLKWFEVFKDDQLQALVKKALVANYDLRTAIARIDVERADLGITRSNQFPQVGGGAELSTGRTSSTAGSSGGRHTFGSVMLNLLTFELDIWGRLRQQTRAAKAEVNASEEDRKAVMSIVVGDVATSYFDLLELDRELDIAKSTLVARQNSLDIIKAREEGGLATMLDVRQAEELVYQASQTVPALERSIQQTENAISVLVGDNPGPIARGMSLTDQQELPSIPTGLPSSLLERRPDIRSAEYQLEAQHALIYAAKAAYFPQISLTGALGSQSSSLSKLFTGPSSAWSFIPQLAQPIFTAGRLKNNVKLARSQQELALIQYQRSIENAFREVSDALIAYQKVKEIHTQKELLVTTLRDRSRLAHLRYDGGVDTLLNALDADRDLFDAQLSLSQTKRDELVTLVQLYKALGGGWQ